MSVVATPALPQTPKSSKVQVVNGSGTSPVTVYTGGSAGPGTKVTAVIAASTDTASRDVQIGTTRSGTFYLLGTITVPANAGNVAGTPAVNLLDPNVVVGLPVDNDGQVYVFLTDATDLLQVQALVTVTSGKAISVTAIGADF